MFSVNFRKLFNSKSFLYILLFFFAIFVLSDLINVEYHSFKNSEISVRNKAKDLAYSYGNQINTKLDAKFKTLEYIGNLLKDRNFSAQYPNEKIETLIKYLVKFYPESLAFSIYSKDDQVIFTTLSNIKDVPLIKFIPLDNNPDMLLGLVHKGYFNKYVLNEAYIVRDDSGNILYKVRTAYFLENLFAANLNSSVFKLIIVDERNNEKIGEISNGIFSTNISNAAGKEISVNVPGYPFEIDVTYPSYLVWQDYFYNSLIRWTLEIIVLILIILLIISTFLFIKRKQNEKISMQRVIDFSSVLSQINQLIANVDEESNFLQSICELAVKFGHLKLASIAKPDQDGTFRMISFSGESEYANSISTSINPDIPEGQGLLGQVWREKIPKYAQSFIKESFNTPWKAMAEKYGIKSSATVPIFRNNEIWACFSIYHSIENIFDKNLKNLLEELARDISIGLDKLDFRKEETEILNIRKSIINNALIGIALIKNRHFIFVNPKFEEIYGYEHHSLVGKSTKILFESEDEYKKAGKIYEELFSNKKTELIEIEHITKDGRKIICEMTANIINDDEKISIWTIQDITEKRMFLEKLRQSEEVYRKIFEDYSAVKLLIDPDNGNIFDANYAAANYYGYSKDDLKRMNISDLNILPKEEIKKEMLKAYKGEKNHFEFKHRIADGSIRDVEVFSNSIQISGKSLLYTIIFDITERKRIQFALENSYSLLNNIIENLPDATFVINYQGKVIAWNKSMELFTGVKKEIMLGKGFEEYSILFYNSPRKLLINAVLESDTNVVLENYNIIQKTEHTIYAEAYAPNIFSGSGAYLFASASRIEDNSGNIIGAIESVRDITELKEIQEEIYKLSITDSLTAAFNRRYFEERLEEEIKRTKRTNQAFSLIMLDIDNFKAVNDSHGHTVGDRVLTELVNTIKKRIRATDLLARWGGEEFMILLVNTDILYAEKVAIELKDKISCMSIDEVDHITASFGVTQYEENDTILSITNRVDELMYAAKAAGKNCVKCNLNDLN